jgi:Bacterial SH3 domain
MMRFFKTYITRMARLTPQKLFVVVLALCFVAATSRIRADSALQVLVSATPVPISLPSPLPFATDAAVATEAPTRTPTPNGPVLLEALNEANVRAQPDTDSERLGTIRNGDVYAVLGRYFRWYKFEYNTSPSGYGWVFDDLVHVIGDETLIPDLTQDALPTIDPISAGATGTMEIVTQTPGGILTVTANAGVIPLPVEGATNGAVSVPALPQSGSVLPTYTYPADIFLPTPVPTGAQSESVERAPTQTEGNPSKVALPSHIPPIAPILILGAIGLIGLFISSYRR